jgi:hypothetical protein
MGVLQSLLLIAAIFSPFALAFGLKKLLERNLKKKGYQ